MGNTPNLYNGYFDMKNYFKICYVAELYKYIVICTYMKKTMLFLIVSQ